ncbi:MAG: hypothetical protein ACTSR8_20570 [Promethearchaeota archaeon]
MLDQGVPISQKVEDIFTRYKYIFLGRQKEIKQFLSKFEEKIFKGKKVSNVERVDNTERLKISGWHSKISSWRDNSGNPIVSICLEIEGKKRRFDYIFYLRREVIESKEEVIEKVLTVPVKKIDIDTKTPPARDREVIMEDIRSIYSDSFRLLQSFQFEQAIIQLDSMIDLLVERNLPEYVKKLEQRRDYLREAQQAFESRKDELKDVEKRAKRLMQENIIIGNHEQFSNSLDIINQTVDELREKHFPEYLEHLEKKKKELAEAQKIYEEMKEEIKKQKVLFDQTILDNEKIQELKNLEKTIKLNKEFAQFEATKVNLEKMIHLLEQINRSDLIEKYSSELEEIKKHFEFIEDG